MALRVNERSYHTRLGLHGWLRQTTLVEDLVRTYSYYVRSVVLDPRIEQGVYQDGSEESGPIAVLPPRNPACGTSTRSLSPTGTASTTEACDHGCCFVRRGNVEDLANHVGSLSNGRRRHRDQM